MIDRKSLIEEAINMARNAYASAVGTKNSADMLAAARTLIDAAVNLEEPYNPLKPPGSWSSPPPPPAEAQSLSGQVEQLAAAAMSAVNFSSGCGSAASTSELHSAEDMRLCPCGDLCPCHIPKDVLGDGGV